MQEESLRAIVASEYPKVQHVLREVIEEGSGVITVGQAQNTSQALMLARNLRPDVVVIDCFLPHIFGLDNILQSRMGGLDAAQTISEEMPSVKVILVNNVDTLTLPGSSPGLDNYLIRDNENRKTDIRLILQHGQDQVTPPTEIIFAHVMASPRASFMRKSSSLSDKLVFFGGFGIAAGWLLTLTVMLAPAGVPIAIAGVVTVLMGVTEKLIGKLWRRFK